jgi:hypothetical protein
MDTIRDNTETYLSFIIIGVNLMQTVIVLLVASIVGISTITLLVAFYSLTIGLQQDWPWGGYIGLGILILSSCVIPVGVIVIHNIVKRGR